MRRRIWVIADDYGFAPGINDAILALIEARRISGTSCMTGFPTWQHDARSLKSCAEDAAIGLHLTLTDQPAVTGHSSLAPEGLLPSFARLARASLLSAKDRLQVRAELDAQYARFIDAFGRQPDFIDGHQHVHFLPVVRDWLRTSLTGAVRPWLRGAPAKAAAAAGTTAKIATISAVALGFDTAMRGAGFTVMGPLAGIYDWRDPTGFPAALEWATANLPDQGLFMCHPGNVDAVLAERDTMLDARPVEFQTLLSERFAEQLSEADISVARAA